MVPLGRLGDASVASSPVGREWLAKCAWVCARGWGSIVPAPLCGPEGRAPPGGRRSPVRPLLRARGRADPTHKSLVVRKWRYGQCADASALAPHEVINWPANEVDTPAVGTQRVPCARPPLRLSAGSTGTAGQQKPVVPLLAWPYSRSGSRPTRYSCGKSGKLCDARMSMVYHD